ncbi:MAG: hypothetical protein L0Z73_20185 [Gammaproteobacteria bacterium]|nr:hypothetical protein [Gammaproteobacteria bacterium]
MRCHYVVFAIVIILILSGCGSNQPANVSQHKKNIQTDIHKAVEIIPQQTTPVIPIDGRLRDEHLQMYVSVKIKQEQLRYETEISTSPNLSANISNAENTGVATKGKTPVSQSNTVKPVIGTEKINYEKMAVEDFEFNKYLYFWAKQTIAETLERANAHNDGKISRAANFSEYVISHNLEMIEKYKDQLRFAENYKLELSESLVKHAAKIGPDVEDQPMALIFLPSS